MDVSVVYWMTGMQGRPGVGAGGRTRGVGIGAGEMSREVSGISTRSMPWADCIPPMKDPLKMLVRSGASWDGVATGPWGTVICGVEN